VSGRAGGGKGSAAGHLIGSGGGGTKKLAVLLRGPGSSYFSDNADTDRLGLVACGGLLEGRLEPAVLPRGPGFS
jgi:hypothetical protein